MQPVPFFAKYPQIAYQLTEDQRIVVTNIMVAFAIRPEIRLNPIFFSNYRVSDGERAEDVSMNVYGNPYLHWVILLINDIINPLSEWPKSQKILDDYITSKYSGISYVFDLKYTNQTGVATDHSYPFIPGKKVFSSIDSRRVGIIQEWNSTLGALTFNPVDPVHSFASDPIQTYDGANLTSLYYASRIIRDASQTAHHFEYAGQQLSPLSPSPLAVIDDYENDAYVSLQTLYAQNSTNVNNYVVTNREYEERLNEAKTRIRVLKPDYIEYLLTRFETLLIQ